MYIFAQKPIKLELAQLNYFTLSKRNRQMSSRKPVQVRKNSVCRKNTKRIEHYPIDERTRVIQKNLVFVTGLPDDLQSKEVVSDRIHFGRYGNVNKIFVNSPRNSRKISQCQAYVTYQTQFQASLAIVALDGYNFDGQPLKVTYGTTKYCSNFIKGYQCRNSECLFLHYVSDKKEVQQGNLKKKFKEKNDQAFDIVCSNIQFLVKKMMEENNEQYGFPTYTQILKFLVDSQFVTEQQIQTYKQQFIPLQIISTQQSLPENINSQRNQLPNQKKKSKSNSFSTMASPSKQSSQIQSILEQKNIGFYFQEKSFQLEQTIEKMIIKKLFRTKQSKSRFHFVKSDKEQIDQLTKLRAIVQKHLIGNN